MKQKTKNRLIIICAIIFTMIAGTAYAINRANN